MPARKVAVATTKRKSPGDHPPSPRSKAKKRLIQGDSNHAAAAVDGASSKPAVSRAHKFIVGLAVQLTSTCDDEEVDVDVQVEGLFRAALSALPAGKLKAELMQNEAAAMKTLAAEVSSIRSKQQQQQQQPQKGGEVATGKDAGVAAACALVPCTAQLYRQARATAEKQSRGIDGTATDNKPLRALALSPRAPLDLLVNAMGSTSKLDGAAAPVSTTLDAAVICLRNLVGALAADPLAAMSPSGLAFFADRAAVLASSASRSLVARRGDSRGGDSITGDKAGLEVEALGLMLRILQVAGLALSAAGGGTTASGLLRATDDGGCGSCRPADPASWLLLPCSPETSSAWNGEVAATPSDSSPGAPPRNEVDSTPPAQISVARLLAHYAASVAACSVGRKAVVKAAQVAATGEGREGSDDESSSESDEEEETGDGPDNKKSNNISVSRHLSALCAANLAGSEPGTLEFLRCVGDAVFATDDGGDVSLAAPLAPACGRALARLRRPAASPAPTAAQFLRRAYAFRVAEALNRSARAASLSLSKPPSRKEAIAPTAIAGRGSSGCASSGGGAAAAAEWDFVGDSSAPPALLEFLGRSEAPAAVGQGSAAQPALKELASRRNSPAAVAELLRSSPACAPAALGPLLSAMERLQGGEEGGGKTAAAATAVGVGGFFVDTGEMAEGAESVVLARLGNGTDVVPDMDEEEVASVASSTVSGSDGNG
ncbi:unnamed protein product [Ectocarpus sp. CCAP 1310/34]|nr:unnamed protein product [Ectocarpus sp. CCAP 1310/34]